MSLQQFTLDSLKDLDAGKAMEAFHLHVKRAAVDCLDRPADPKPRVVNLQLSIVPVVEPDGTCDRVDVQIHASSKVPNHRTRVYSFGLRRNGMLVFNPDSPESVDQGTFLPDSDED
jgi:hypothetical protein